MNFPYKVYYIKGVRCVTTKRAIESTVYTWAAWKQRVYESPPSDWPGLYCFQMQITLAVLALVALSFGEAKPILEEPKFCNDLECPHFNTINKTDKYEVRSYPTPYKWVSTVVAGRKFVLFVSAVYSFLLYPARQNGRKLSDAVPSNGVTRERVTS